MKGSSAKNSGVPGDLDSNLTRLLQSASQQADDVPATPPFGFETRVVAQWRALAPNGNGLSALVRRVALIATAVIVVSSSAMIYAIRNNRDRFSEPLTNEFALAEYAIQDEASQ
jgi:hypothetical protein